jgi:hypothetical protein
MHSVVSTAQKTLVRIFRHLQENHSKKAKTSVVLLYHQVLIRNQLGLGL